MDHFLIFWICGIAIIWPIWFWVSIQSRRKIGEAIIPKAPAGAQFCERGASGSARGNIFGNARNCLMVSVVGSELWITPTFPFNLIAPYGFLGLEHRVSKSQVLQAETRRHFFGSTVEIEISTPSGNKALSLRLKNPDAFLSALGR